MPPTPASLLEGLFSTLENPFTGEDLFDCLTDLVFFIKNHRGEYVVVNQTLADRCGFRRKQELIGKRADEVFPPPLGPNFRAQDDRVLKHGLAIRNQLELHTYPGGDSGWCLTAKLPLRGHGGKVAGLSGISKDIQSPNESSEDFARVALAVQHIQGHFGEPLKVPGLARMAGLSTYQFEQRIRKIFHLTPGQLIQKTRMESALQRLRTSEEPIASVALESGYSDQSAFTRQFRQATGMSPSEFRKSSFTN